MKGRDGANGYRNGRYVSQCLICPWVSPRYGGPVFAAWKAVGHTKDHPEAEGLVAVVIETQPKA